MNWGFNTFCQKKCPRRLNTLDQSRYLISMENSRFLCNMIGCYGPPSEVSWYMWQDRQSLFLVPHLLFSVLRLPGVWNLLQPCHFLCLVGWSTCLTTLLESWSFYYTGFPLHTFPNSLHFQSSNLLLSPSIPTCRPFCLNSQSSQLLHKISSISPFPRRPMHPP